MSDVAWLFVRLKTALLRGRFRGGWQVKLGIVLSVVVGLPAGVLGALLLLVGGRAGDVDLALAVGVCTFLTLAWTLGPPLLFGVDDTLDPARLLGLPLDRRSLAVGMLASSAVGVGPMVTLLLLGGLAAGIAPLSPLTVVVVLAAVGQFVSGIVLSRLVTTALSDVLRSRRGQEAAGFATVLALIVLPQVPSLVLGQELDDAGGLVTRIVDIVQLTPVAWFGTAMGRAATRDTAASIAALAAGTLLTTAAAWAWVVSLERLVTRTPRQAGRRSDRPDALFRGIAGRLPRTRLGATAAKEVRLYGRDGRLRLALTIGIGFGVVGLVVAINMLDRAPRSLMALVVTGLVLAFNAINVFGVDGTAATQFVLAGGDHADDLRGKHVAVLLLAAPFVLLEVVVAATVIGAWTLVPAALLATTGVLLLGFAVGSLTSVQFPAPQPELGLNQFNAAAGQNMTNGLFQGLAVLAMMVALVPYAAVVALVASPVALTIVAVLLAATGAVLWQQATRWAGRRLATRAPEFLADLEPA